MEYKPKHEENEFNEMVESLKKQCNRRRGLMKRFEEAVNPIYELTSLGKMLLYS